jgi:hypothetical protein
MGGCLSGKIPHTCQLFWLPAPMGPGPQFIVGQLTTVLSLTAAEQQHPASTDQPASMADSTKLSPAEVAASVAAFMELGVCSQLAEAAASLGWKLPSVIQTQAIPHLLQGA